MPAPNELLLQDANDLLLYVFDWSAWLPASVTINTSSWAITGADSALVKDSEGFVDGSNQTKTKLRLSVGTVGVTYKITNRIVTAETPAQTKELSFFVKVRDE